MSTKMKVGYANRSVKGFTLVELMISMLLGLLVIAGVVSVFVANKQSYRSNQALGQVQDSTRIAFELLGRDIRAAGGTPCGNPASRVANVVNYASTNYYWADWNNAITGYDNTGAIDDTTLQNVNTANGGAPVKDTDSVHLMGAGLATGLTVVTQHQNAANFKVSANTSDFQSGDIIMVCDPDHATILQITNYNSSNVTVEYNTGNGQTPGNCSKGLGFPTIPANCGAAQNANGNGYSFGENSQLAKLDFYDWYIGTNPAGGRSLYRVELTNTAGSPGIGAPQEMVRGITDMQLTYHINDPNNTTYNNTYVNATTVTANNEWLYVDAVRVTLVAQSTLQRVTTGSNPQPLLRTFTSTVTLRNRVN